MKNYNWVRVVLSLWLFVFMAAGAIFAGHFCMKQIQTKTTLQNELTEAVTQKKQLDDNIVELQSSIEEKEIQLENVRTGVEAAEIQSAETQTTETQSVETQSEDAELYGPSFPQSE